MATNNKDKDIKRRRSLFVNWKEVNGASVKKRVLHFAVSEKGEYLCPVKSCLHIGFKSQRGIRKHINNIHPWYLFFDDQPTVNRTLAQEHTEVIRKVCTHNFPAFTLEIGIGKDFLKWLQTPCGGGRTAKEAKNIARRAMKFLMSSYGENSLQTVLKEDYIDCCIGSPRIVMDFLKLITEEWGLQAGSALSYMKSIGDLLDFRKASGVSDDALRSFTVTEVYVRRGKENLAKKKKLEYGRNLDLETLISRNSWASLEEMEQVIPYHTPKYEYVWKKCKARDDQPTVGELSFASRFIVTFLFLRVKCTRPMTFQYLTLDMINSAKSNGGYVDQTTFKTKDKYVFDTLILTEEVLKILDSYIKIIRPFMSPKCEYILVTCNGTQYTAFGSAMSLLVYQAIGKSVNPTRYRQIVESESAVHLTDKEREVVSKDQRHGSQVAKRIYQKRLSREVASEARSCLQKMTGTEKEKHNQNLASFLSESSSKPSCSKDNENAISADEETSSQSTATSIMKPASSENIPKRTAESLPNNDATRVEPMENEQVARKMYPKRLSRELASDNRSCTQKVSVTEKEQHNSKMATSVSDGSSKPGCSKDYLNVSSGGKQNTSQPTKISITKTASSEEVHNQSEETFPYDDATLTEAMDTEPENEVCEVIDVTTEAHLNMGSIKSRPNTSINNQPSADVKTEDEYEGMTQPNIESAINLPAKEVKVENIERQLSDNTRLKRFTIEEDRFLRDGVSKYGYGMWKDIFKDKDFTFHPSRTRDSLRMRAKTLKIKKKVGKKSQ